MITHICDRCSRPLEEREARYVARIEVFAAADPLNITLDDLMRDTRQEIEQVVQQSAELTEEELMRDVYVEFKFDLCRRCQRTYIANPLPLKPAS